MRTVFIPHRKIPGGVSSVIVIALRLSMTEVHQKNVSCLTTLIYSIYPTVRFVQACLVYLEILFEAASVYGAKWMASRAWEDRPVKAGAISAHGRLARKPSKVWSSQSRNLIILLLRFKWIRFEFEFEWGFTPSRHLRPSSGREHHVDPISTVAHKGHAAFFLLKADCPLWPTVDMGQRGVQFPLGPTRKTRRFTVSYHVSCFRADLDKKVYFDTRVRLEGSGRQSTGNALYKNTLCTCACLLSATIKR